MQLIVFHPIIQHILQVLSIVICWTPLHVKYNVGMLSPFSKDYICVLGQLQHDSVVVRVIHHMHMLCAFIHVFVFTMSVYVYVTCTVVSLYYVTVSMLIVCSLCILCLCSTIVVV